MREKPKPQGGETGARRDRRVVKKFAEKISWQGMQISEIPEWRSRIDEILGLLPEAVLHDFSTAIAKKDQGPDIEAFSALYGLTAAEDRLLHSLAEGQSLAEYAKQRDISVNTARVQRQHVLQKCGVHKQAALLAKLFAFKG